MGVGECYNANPECKYFNRESREGGNVENGCFSDTDHIYGRARKLGKWARKFANLPENKRQICRDEHDEINADFVHLELPSLEVMKLVIERYKNA